MRAVSFETRKEERAVPDDRSAECSPELVALKRALLSRIEEVLRVHLAIAIELKARAVNCVCTGLGCDDDLPAGVASVFRRIRSRQHFEFLNGVDRRPMRRLV